MRWISLEIGEQGWTIGNVRASVQVTRTLGYGYGEGKGKSTKKRITDWTALEVET